MKRPYTCLLTILVIIMITSTGCSKGSDDPTITINQNSTYLKTFEDLDLGVLLAFNFKLPKADKRWITLTIEKYEQGKKASEPLDQISYGQVSEDLNEGEIGFGMINDGSDKMSTFLYSPDASTQLSPSVKASGDQMASAWGYGIKDEEEVDLKLGESQILGAYREVKNGVVEMVDMQNDASVKQMINHDTLVLLVTVKVEDSQPDEE